MSLLQIYFCILITNIIGMTCSAKLLNRRQFIKQAGLGLLGFLISACHPTILTAGRGSQRTQTPFRSLTVTPRSAIPAVEPIVAFFAGRLPGLVGEEEAAFLAIHEVQ